MKYFVNNLDYANTYNIEGTPVDINFPFPVENIDPETWTLKEIGKHALETVGKSLKDTEGLVFCDRPDYKIRVLVLKKISRRKV